MSSLPARRHHRSASLIASRSHGNRGAPASGLRTSRAPAPPPRQRSRPPAPKRAARRPRCQGNGRTPGSSPPPPPPLESPAAAAESCLRGGGGRGTGSGRGDETGGGLEHRDGPRAIDGRPLRPGPARLSRASGPSARTGGEGLTRQVTARSSRASPRLPPVLRGGVGRERGTPSPFRFGHSGEKSGRSLAAWPLPLLEQSRVFLPQRDVCGEPGDHYLHTGSRPAAA